MLITLSDHEQQQAAMVGVLRQLEAMRKGYRPTPGERPDFSQHIEGAGAECALAKHLGLYWSGLGHLAPTDVGPYQVRQTNWRSGVLIIREPHDEPGPYVLVTGKLPRYLLAGWLVWPNDQGRCYRGQPDEGRPECWCCDQDALRSMTTLPRKERASAATT